MRTPNKSSAEKSQIGVVALCTVDLCVCTRLVLWEGRGDGEDVWFFFGASVALGL